MATRRVILATGECLLARRCLPTSCPAVSSAGFATSSRRDQDKQYQLLILGGGTAGSAIAHKFASRLGKDHVAVIEPNERHYYQPMWTLVGAGLKKFSQSERMEEDILPKGCTWIKDRVTKVDPDNNYVTTANGDLIGYDYLVVAMGLQLNYHKIEGLMEAFQHDPMVCSNYSKDYVRKTWHAAQTIQEGNAIFTFPASPVKCAGAPQKICYLTEDYFRRSGKRDKINVLYNTSLPVIFGIPRYAKVLEPMCNRREIQINKRRNLVKVDHKTRTATFALLDSETGETEDYEYGMLHVAPPCSTPEPLWNTPLVDATNFVSVNRDTLQHTSYSNVFGMGDCINAPTAKTAAAISAQVGVVKKNLNQVMEGKTPKRTYDGYTSCPILVTRKTCIMAEFGYDGSILETFPVNQSKERRLMFYMKKDFMPALYWHALVRGLWNGPGIFRKAFHLGQEQSKA